MVENKIIQQHTPSGIVGDETDTMTINEMIAKKYPCCCDQFLHKVRLEYAKLYSGQTLLDKLLAISKKLEAGLNVFTENFCLSPNYINLGKQYIQDAYDASKITEEQYNILYGVADSTLPA